MSDRLEVKKCHHCGHEWEPRVKNPKKCPQCQNPLWKSERPKQKRPTQSVEVAEPMPIVASEEAAPTPPTTATPTPEPPPAVSGADVPESPVQRLQREAEERLHRLANAPID